MIISGTAQFAIDQLSKVRDEYNTDPQQGPSRITEWHGLYDALLAYLGTLGQVRSRLAPLTGPLWSLIVYTYGGGAVPDQDPLDETPTDRWTTNTNILERELWMHPIVYNAAITYDSANPNKFKRQLEVFAADENPSSSPEPYGDTSALPPPYASNTVASVAQEVVKELGRGVTHYEDEYLVLRRTRSISTSYPVAMPLYSVRYIYQTAQIGMPANVAFSLPIFPPNPPQSLWGWRLRTQQSEFVGPTRVEQVFEWVLAAWSTLLYIPATANFPP